MSEENNLPNKKDKNWINRFFKLVFMLSAFLLVGITVLSNMGGNGDAWKSSVEQFASGFFGGKPAKVENLKYMSFFPKIGFDAENINIYSNPDNKITLASIGKVQAFMGFWNVAFRTQKFSHFYLENFRAVKGAITPKELYIEKIFIDHDIENSQALMRSNGKIGSDLWDMRFDLDVIKSLDILDSKNKFNFRMPHEFSYEINISDMKSNGTFIRSNDNYYKFKDFIISSGSKFISGNVVISALGGKLIKIKGAAKSSNQASISKFDLVFDYAHFPVKVSGSMGLNDIIIKDIISMFMHIREIIGYKNIFENDTKNLMFDFDSVKSYPDSNKQEHK